MVSKGISEYIKAFIMDKHPYHYNPGSWKPHAFLVLIKNINPDKTLRYSQKIPGQNKYLCPAYKISIQDYDIEAPNSHQRSW